MNEFCLMMFHTLLSSTVLQTNSMSKLRINVDGWMKPNPEYLQSMTVVTLFVIHLDLLLSSIRTQSLRSVVDYECCSSGKDGDIGPQTDRDREKEGAERETAQPQPIALHPYRFIICTVAQDISQLCLPWTLP